MKDSTLVVLKGAAVILTLLLALIGILYVMEVFSSEDARVVVQKTMTIMGILTGACLIMVFLTRKA